jgi:hypothetical protein
MSSITVDANQLPAIMTVEKLFSFLTKGKVIAKFADSSSIKGLNVDKTTSSNHHIPMPSSREGGQRSPGIVMKNWLQ